MEPLSKEMREALKRAHPGLTDEIIDRHEELIRERFQQDPNDRANIERLTTEAEALARLHMPHYAEVAQVVQQEKRLKRGPRRRRIEVVRKGPREK